MSDRQPTPKQAKLVSLISDNLRRTEGTRTLGELMLEAGYSKSQSEKPGQITKSPIIQEAIDPVIKSLRKIRENALKALIKRNMEEEKARDVIDIIDKTTKNDQLLSGKPTERTKVEISDLDKQMTDEVIKDL